MKKRAFNILTACSAILFFLSAAAWLSAWSIDPQKQFLTLRRSCHLSLRASGLDARLAIFNDAGYGPYTGSIIGIASANRTSVRDPSVRGFGDSFGLYFRLIRWKDGRLLWTALISLLYPLIISSILPMVWSARRFRGRQRGFPVGPSRQDFPNKPSSGVVDRSLKATTIEQELGR